MRRQARAARRELASRLGMPVPPPIVTELGARGRQILGRLHRRGAPPIVGVMESMLAIFDNRVLELLVSSGVVDHLDRPRTGRDLAETVGLDADGLERVLRYAAARGFVTERRGRFRSTAITDALASDHGSLRPWVQFLGSAWVWDAIRNLDAALAPEPRSGIHAATGHGFFDYVNDVDPDAGRVFNGAMAAGSPLQALALVATLDWAGVRSVCDVGGGTGATAEVLLRHLDGVAVTVFDLPSVVDQVDPAGGLLTHPGDFFDHVPTGHDRYLLLAIVHDWSDDEAVALLRVVADALSPTARVIVVETTLDQPGTTEFATASDLLMLTLASGRERTRDDLEALFVRAGLAVERLHKLPTGFSAFELARRPTAG